MIRNHKAAIELLEENIDNAGFNRNRSDAPFWRQIRLSDILRK